MNKIQRNSVLTRDAAGLERAEGERTFRLSFSSETPVPRWGEMEILDHADGAADLTRLRDMGVVLFNHNRDDVVGRVTKVSVENGRGVAEVMFDEDEAGERIYSKVASGTLRGVSVNYRIDAVETVRAGAVSADGRFAGPACVARKWTPLEISIVSVPADVSVGVGRELQGNEKEDDPMNEMDTTRTTDNTLQAAPLERAEAPAQTIIVPDPAQAERRRAADITDICRSADIDPAEHIRSGASAEEVLRKVNERLIAEKAPLNLTVERDEGDKYRAAAVDALLMRGGVTIENPADGARELRPLSLRELAIETLHKDGTQNARRMDNDALLGELQRAYFSPTVAFPAILDETVNKAYRKGYEQTPTTFERWTGKGSLSDFKVSRSQYLAGAAGDFLRVPEGGELKHDVPKDYARPGRQLQTYGRQFTLTREAFINDDIGFVTSVPARYAAAARRTINKQVYSVLTGNAVIYDGDTLFSNDHGNDMPGSAPSQESIRRMIEKIMLMKDDDGNPISVAPRHILAPVGLASDIRQIIGAASIAVNINGVITTQSNPLADRALTVIEDPFLNTLANAEGWYMLADPATLPAIQVDYLNGNEIPTIRRNEVPGQLGFVWDIWLDWGVTAVEYRGIVRNLGK